MLTEGEGDYPILRRAFHLALWVPFVIWGAFFSPGHLGHMRLLAKLVRHPYATDVNTLYVAVFNFLGIMPTVYALLLLPGARGQWPPTWIPVSMAFFLNYLVLGPYLIVRKYEPYIAYPCWPEWIPRMVEGRIVPVMLLVGYAYIIVLVTSSLAVNTMKEVCDFVHLFKTNMAVNLPTLDLILLCIAVVDPLREDMLRRSWYSPAKLLAFACVPVVGPCLYLLVRPKLPIKED